MYKGFWLSNAISFLNFNLYLSLAQGLELMSMEANPDYSKLLNKDTIPAIMALVFIHPLDTLKYIPNIK